MPQKQKPTSTFVPPNQNLLKGAARAAKDSDAASEEVPIFNCSYRNKTENKNSVISIDICLYVTPEDLQTPYKELQDAFLSIIKPDERITQNINSHKVEGTETIEFKFNATIENASVDTFSGLYAALWAIYKNTIPKQEATS